MLCSAKLYSNGKMLDSTGSIAFNEKGHIQQPYLKYLCMPQIQDVFELVVVSVFLELLTTYSSTTRDKNS